MGHVLILGEDADGASDLAETIAAELKCGAVRSEAGGEDRP